MDGKFLRDDNLVDIPTAENPRWQSISLASTGTYSTLTKLFAVLFFLNQSDVSFLGVCYDSINNLIWTSSEDWVDEWLNIGASSYHHVVHKISPKPRGIVMCLKLLNLKSQGPKAVPSCFVAIFAIFYSFLQSSN